MEPGGAEISMLAADLLAPQKTQEAKAVTA